MTISRLIIVIIAIFLMLYSCYDIEDTTVDTRIQIIGGDIDFSKETVYATHIDYKVEPDETLYHNIPLRISMTETQYLITRLRTDCPAEQSDFCMAIMKDDVNSIYTVKLKEV